MKKLMAVGVAVMALVGTAHAFEGPCKADIEKFCKGVQKGDGRIVSCLKDHKEGLSTECKIKILEMKEKQDKK